MNNRAGDQFKRNQYNAVFVLKDWKHFLGPCSRIKKSQPQKTTPILIKTATVLVTDVIYPVAEIFSRAIS